LLNVLKNRIRVTLNSSFWNDRDAMNSFNYKHLHYFWVIAKSGGVAKAGERLHVTPQAISTQMRQLEADIGEALWRRAGRKLELTDAGHMVFDYADRLFSVGEELREALRERRSGGSPGVLRVGILDSVVKVVAWRLVEPLFGLELVPRLLLREGRMNELLALLAVHELDVVISDRPMPGSLHVRGYNHLLVECGITFLARAEMAKPLRKRFPQSLDGAPMLLPGGDSALRPQLMRWLDQVGAQPRIVAEFDDTALMKAFGQGGVGVFPMPSVVAAETAAQFRVVPVGQTNEVVHQVYAVTPERRVSNEAVITIRDAAVKFRG
jgi:LysR family transcriptional regulator, transcriptional activator of nhaA